MARATGNDGPPDALPTVLRWASISRLATLALGTALDFLVLDYDTSTGLLNPTGSAVPTAFAHWDAVYFLHLAGTRDYAYEHFAAFFPGYPLAVGALAQTVLRPLTVLCSERAILLAAALLLSNVCFVAAAGLLYRLTEAVLEDRRWARAAALLFCLSPASVFLSAAYTESCYTMLGFAGMLAWVCQRRWAAAGLFALATAVRSNGILLAGFFLYDALHAVGRRPGLWAGAWSLVALGAQAGLVVAPYLAFQSTLHRQYCGARPGLEWCSRGPLGLYGYVQERYWGVGLLRYYRLSQMPNFGIAAPTAVLCTGGLLAFARRHPALMCTAGLAQSPRLPPEAPLDSFWQLPPHIAARCVVFGWYLAAQVLFALLVMHVQVLTRFVVASPMLYWIAARCVLVGQPRWLARGVVFYFLLWGALGCLLFCNFYPWT